MIKQPTNKLKIRILSETSIPYLIRHASFILINNFECKSESNCDDFKCRNVCFYEFTPFSFLPLCRCCIVDLPPEGLQHCRPPPRRSARLQTSPPEDLQDCRPPPKGECLQHCRPSPFHCRPSQIFVLWVFTCKDGYSNRRTLLEEK